MNEGVGIGIMAAAYFGFMGFLMIVGLLLFAFWIWMLVDCATNEPSEGNDKIVWILVIVLTHWIGAAVYYFARRPQRMSQTGSGPLKQ